MIGTEVIMVIGVILALALLSGVVLWSTEWYELLGIGILILGGIYLTK